MYLIRISEEENVPPIKDAVASFAKSLGIPVSPSLNLVFDKWDVLVGDYLATKTYPIAIKDFVLLIAAANPTIAKEIKLKGPSLVNTINGIIKSQVVRKIEVKTGANYARQFR